MGDLETGIVELFLAESTGNRDHIEDLKTKKSALADLLGTKARGAIKVFLRSGEEELVVSTALIQGGAQRRKRHPEVFTYFTLTSMRTLMSYQRSEEVNAWQTNWTRLCRARGGGPRKRWASGGALQRALERE